MIKDVAFWREWELRRMAAEPVDVERNLRLADSMFALARSLGRLPEPQADLMARLEHKLRLARACRALGTAGQARTSA
jgi:hypothetical protein